MSKTVFEAVDAERVQARIDSGPPRYSIRLQLKSGGFIRRWTGDRQEALAHHAQGMAETDMKAVFTYDHIGLDMIAVDVHDDGRSYEQIKADSNAAINAMIDRWAADLGF